MIGWNGESFGADQEAYVTFTDVDTGEGNEHGLILKSQSAGAVYDGAIEVAYDGASQRVQVWTFTPGQGWILWGDDIPVTFVDGDVLGVRAFPNGWVEIYQNEALIGRRNLSTWEFSSSGGYIGMLFYHAWDAVLDDFGGGSVSGGESMLMTPLGDQIMEGLDTNDASSQFVVEFSKESSFWQGMPTGMGPKPFVILPLPNASEKKYLTEKPQEIEKQDLLKVVYDIAGGRIQVWLYDAQAGTDWVQYGKDIPVKFAEGDTFTASVTPEGVLEIYQDGKLLIQQKLGSISPSTVSLASTPQPIANNASVSTSSTHRFQPISYRASGAYPPDLPEPVLSRIERFTLLNSVFQQQTSSLTIDYTYDALNRLTSATYSDGRNFAYTYDPSGNVLELEQNLGPGTIITAYTYDEANQLNTAQQGSTTWQYTYDANGSLISDGVKNYTYDSANRLVEVSDQSSVTSLSYNGLGQRLSMDAAGVIAHYVMDGDRPLTAESGGNTTFYLYGLGAIGEKTTEWNFSLPDGTNTPRQLTDIQGAVTLSARYTPWGDTLELNGTGNFSFGYLGGILDAATNLIYIGNGQYYDPETGRFLTRDVNPDSTNPYVPWNPIGAILGPLGLISLIASRKRGRANPYLLMFVMLVVLPVGIGMACIDSGNLTPTQPNQPPIIGIGTPGPSTTQYAPVITPTSSITPPSLPCDCTATPSVNQPLPFPYTPSLGVEYAIRWARVINPDFGEFPGTDCANFVSQAILAGINGSLPDGVWRPGSQAWIGAPALYKFLSERFLRSEYTNDKSTFGYYRLRGYPKWENEFLQNTSIQPGDIVFYWDESMARNIDLNIYPLNIYPDQYTHTAIVVDTWPETEYANKDLVPANPNVWKPRVVDHSGPTGNNLPRSIDDTANTSLKKVAVIHMALPK